MVKASIPLLAFLSIELMMSNKASVQRENLSIVSVMMKQAQVGSIADDEVLVTLR